MRHCIETKDLVRVFKSKNEIVKALDKVSISIEEGEIFGLLGPNGAGKTTFIKILTTLLLPTSGEAYVGGFNVVKEADKVRKIISLVSGGETPGYGILSVRENLWFFSQLYGLSSSVAKEDIKRLMADLDFEEYAGTRMSKLSTGYRQRLNLARGLLSKPKILFLDEPTLGLDVLTAKKLREYIVDWAKRERKGTVLLTTHYMAEADEMCDRVAIIDRGRILACDSPFKLKENLKENVIVKVEILVAGTIIFQAPLIVNEPFTALLLFFLTIIALYALGMLFASLFMLYGREAWHTASLLQEPVYFLSGSYFPVRALPFFIQLVASFIPLTFGLDGIRRVVIEGAGIADVWVDIIALVIFIAVLLPLAKFALNYM